MDFQPAHIVLVVALLGGIAVMNLAKSEKPQTELKEFVQGLVLGVFVVAIVATVVRVGWKAVVWAWS